MVVYRSLENWTGEEEKNYLYLTEPDFWPNLARDRVPDAGDGSMAVVIVGDHKEQLGKGTLVGGHYWLLIEEAAGGNLKHKKMWQKSFT